MATTTADHRQSPVRSRVGPGACVRPAADLLLTCECGQALDTWGARHCPRCGVPRAGRTP
jgi:hypothetical protein